MQPGKRQDVVEDTLQNLTPGLTGKLNEFLNGDERTVQKTKIACIEDKLNVQSGCDSEWMKICIV